MNIAALKIFLLSRIFLGSSGTFVLLLLAITFNWFDAYSMTRHALTVAIEAVDVMHEWGGRLSATAEKMGDAYEKAQKELGVKE